MPTIQPAPGAESRTVTMGFEHREIADREPVVLDLLFHDHAEAFADDLRLRVARRRRETAPTPKIGITEPGQDAAHNRLPVGQDRQYLVVARLGGQVDAELGGLSRRVPALRQPEPV